MKFIKLFTILILTAFIFTSCGSKEDEPVEIEFWHSMQGPLLVTLQKLVRQFENENPYITVNLKYQGSYTQLLQRLDSEIATGKPPNISQAFGAWTDKFINDDLLLPLQGKLGDADKDFYEIFYRNNLFNGQLYSIPFNKSIPILYYNKDHFEAAGLDPNTPPTTWAQFKEFSITLNKELNKDNPENPILPLSFAPSIWFITSMYYQNGGRFYDDKTDMILPDSEILAAAISYFTDLNKEGLVDLQKSRKYQEKFINQEVSMIFASCVSLTFMKEDIKFNMGFVPIPQGKSNGSILSGTNLIVFKSDSKNENEASIKLLQFLLKPENIGTWVKETNYLPSRRSVLNDPAFKAYLKDHPTLVSIYDEIDHLSEEPKTEKWVTGRKKMRTTLEKIFFLNVPVKEALDEFYKETK